MARFYYAQTSFSSGQVSPKLHARTDVEEFRNGLEESLNFLAYPNGGASYRPGARIVDLSVANDVQDPPASLAVYGFWAIEAKLANGTSAQVTIEYRVGAFNAVGRIVYSDYTAAPITVQPDAFSEIVRLANLGINIFEGWHYAQKDSVIVMTHASGECFPLVLVLTATGGILYSWNADNITSLVLGVPQPIGVPRRYLRVPVGRPNRTSITLTPSVSTGTGTLTASENLFTSGDIGSFYYLDNEADPALTLVVEITDLDGTNPATVANIAVVAGSSGPAYSAGTATPYWYVSSWSRKEGYPRSVTVYQNRFVFGGSTNSPSTLWFSESSGFFNMNRYFQPIDNTRYTYTRTPDEASFPFDVTIASSSSDAITFLVPVQDLIVGTDAREYSVTSGGNSFTLDNISVIPQSSYGSAPYMPALAENKVYFISRDRRSIVQLEYQENNRGFVPINISNLSDEILYEEGGSSARYNGLQYQGSANRLWAKTNAGTLNCVTINDSTGVLAFSKVKIENTTVLFTTVATSFSEGYDFIWLLCARPDGAFGPNYYTLEIPDNFEGDFLFPDSPVQRADKGIYLDWSTDTGVYDSGTGLWEIDPSYEEGVEVTYVTSEGDVGVATVTGSGQKFIAAPEADEIYVGFEYTGKIKTLNFEVGPNVILNSQGDTRRIDRVTAIVYRSWAGKYGVKSETALSSKTSDLYSMKLGVTSFTGRLRLDVPASPDTENKVIIENDGPFPLNILGLTFRGQNNP